MPDLVTSTPLLALAALIAYLVGAIPFGTVIARLFGLGNLRDIGSGNIGATNVLRTGNKLAAFLTLILDAGKAGAAVLVARSILGEDAAQVAGFFAFLGHCFPVYLKFKGGKGVATFFGMLIALYWPLGIAAGAVWIFIAYTFRFSSLAALMASLMAPAIAWGLGRPDFLVLTVMLTILVWVRHSENITRLLNGTESKIGASKD
ncbi:MAG: glycerol-3-phosphate 1-O-acyltransferase PlsY [Dinoroseobacter sp.]|nr:glycerol-3-phosphate 1-O-acyltransferase PlsY [Dinoroseobacter sp.]NQZ71427.1 glycerol-3-phosphate 1-O-acyltransferase PlsY [Dinoroseobacter sp.]